MANSKRKCTGCQERFPAEGMTKHPSGYFHSMDCSLAYVRAKRSAATARKLAKAKRDQKAVEKVARAKHRADKESIKPISKLKAEAQAAFNLNVRLRDYWEPCISCGKSKEEVEADQGWKVGGCWDAGHFKTRGAKPQLRFNLFNVHKQCKSCNGGGGRFSAKAATVDAQYEINLIDKIGAARVAELKNNNDIVRFDADYYRRIKKIFSKKSKLRKHIIAALG